MRRTWAALACAGAALLGPVVAAQDVRVSEYSDEHQGASYFVDSFGLLRPVWVSNCATCPNGTLMREFALSGVPLSSDTQMNEVSTDGLGNAAAVLPSGRFILVGTNSRDIWGRVFDVTGAPITGDFLIRTGMATTQQQDVAASGPSSFVVLWDITSTGQLFGRIVNDDGTLPGGEVLLEQATPASLLSPRIAAFSTGDLLVVWLLQMTGPPRADLLGRVYDGTLTPLGAAATISQTQVRLWDPALATVGSRALVVWDRSTVVESDVVGRWVDRRSGPTGSEFILNTYPDVQGKPDLGFDAQGGAVVSWISYGQDGSSVGVFGQRFDAAGNPFGPEFRVNMTTWNPQGTPRITVLPSGDFAVMFGSTTGDNLDDEVLMRRFFFPVSLTLGPGPGPSNTPRAAILRPDGRLGFPAIAPYAGTPGYGTTVGAGDVDGGLDDILTGPGPSPSYGPQVRGWKNDGTAIQKINFYAYGTLKYGVKEGTADLDGDAYREILTTPGPGAVFGPHVRGWNYDGTTLQPIAKVSFFAFNTLKYGANGSRAELEADGFDEMLATPGPGQVFGAQLRAFNYDNTAVTAIAKINAYVFTGTSFGATVSAADIDSDGVGSYMDGYDEIVVGKGPGSGNDGEMRVFDYGTSGLALMQRWAVTSPLPYAPWMYGINVAGGDVDAGDTQEIATAPGPDPAATARIFCWEWNPKLGYAGNPIGATLQVIGTDDFTAFAGMTYGANVAIGTFE